MEHVFQQVGNCGCFQICHIVCIQLLRFIATWAINLMVFGNYEPHWQCVRRIKNWNSSHYYNTHGNDTGYRITDGSFDFNTSLDTKILHLNDTGDAISDRPTHQASVESPLNFTGRDFLNDPGSLIPGTCVKLKYCDDVIFDPSSVTLVSEFRLICDHAYIPSVIIAAQMLGIIIGANLGGQTGELYGRKVSIYSSLFLMAAGTFMASWSVSWQMHTALTFIIGLGSGGIMTSSMVYSMEYLTPSWRGRFAAIPVRNIGLATFSVLVVGLKDWRNIYLVNGVVGGACLLGALWAPESLRWLHVQGKEKKVRNVLEKIMRLNRRQGDVSQIIRQLNESSKDEIYGRKYTYIDLFRTSDHRNLTIKLTIVWIFIVMPYYTLSFSVKALSGDYYTNLLLAYLLEIVFVVMVGPLVNNLGRNRTLRLFMCLAALFTVACVVIHFTTSPEISGQVIKYLAILAKGSLVACWMAVQVLSVELFPTVVRSLALGFFNTMARVGGLVSCFLIPRDKASSMIVCFFVLSGISVLAVVLILTLPETKGKPLVDRVQKSEPKDEEALDRESKV